MTRLNWNSIGNRFFEFGVDRGVLYVDSNNGVAWNGLISVDETSDSGESKTYYIDGEMYLNRATRPEFSATITAFYSPPEFDSCEGISPLGLGLFASQQRRKSFGLCYRTKIGNDVDGDSHAYKIHIIYNALALSNDKSYGTTNEQLDPLNLSWTITAKPERFVGVASTSHIIIDSSITPPDTMDVIENILYGDDSQTPRLPSPEELTLLFNVDLGLIIVDNGDGTFSVTGPDDKVISIDTDTYEISSPAAMSLGNTFKLTYLD